MRERFPAVFDRIDFIKKIGPYRTIDQKIEKHIDKYNRMSAEEKKKAKQRLIDSYIQFRKNGGKNK
tara:strand:- start:95930 stop:96127 length:198 start_codon:yes stop_codon:yes gene_type:complete